MQHLSQCNVQWKCCSSAVAVELLQCYFFGISKSWQLAAFMLINDVIAQSQKVTNDLEGGVVSIPPKNDDVIYEQPLMSFCQIKSATKIPKMQKVWHWSNRSEQDTTLASPPAYLNHSLVKAAAQRWQGRWRRQFFAAIFPHFLTSSYLPFHLAPPPLIYCGGCAA